MSIFNSTASLTSFLWSTPGVSLQLSNLNVYVASGSYYRLNASSDSGATVQTFANASLTGGVAASIPLLGASANISLQVNNTYQNTDFAAQVRLPEK